MSQDRTDRAAITLGLELGHTFQSVDPPKPGPNTLRLARVFLEALAADGDVVVKRGGVVVPMGEYEDG